MSLQHAVLGVLEARAMTGYELTQFFESTARWVWTAPQSQIYPLLRQMEKAGLIAGEEQVRGEKLKRVSYSLTNEGMAELKRWAAAPQPEAPTRDALLLQALFADLITPEQCEAVLNTHIAELAANIARWEAHRDQLLKADTPLLRERLARRDAADHARIIALKAHVFDGMARQARERLAWSREMIEIVRGDVDNATAASGAESTN